MAEEQENNEPNTPPRGGDSYSAEDLQHLSDLEHVRERPSMYIGDTTQRGLHHLVYEVVDNSIDEAMAGHATTVSVSINVDGSVTVEDDGRGIPVERHAQLSEEVGRDMSTLEGVTIARISDPPTVNGKPTRWLPLMSVPSVLDLRPDTVPADVPYLAAEPSRVAQWDAWLGSDGFKIGINWALGNQRSRFARRRDVPLSAFAPLAAIPGVRLISLQVGPPTQQIASVAFRDKIETPEADTNPADGSFVDTAALMTKLDLIVSCDTSLVHLAGALARPVFTAMSFVPDWRWMQEREDTPWYPTMRLFRQRSPQNWDDVFARIAAAAAEMASAQQR